MKGDTPVTRRRRSSSTRFECKHLRACAHDDLEHRWRFAKSSRAGAVLASGRGHVKLACVHSFYTFNDVNNLDFVRRR